MHDELLEAEGPPGTFELPLLLVQLIVSSSVCLRKESGTRPNFERRSEWDEEQEACELYERPAHRTRVIMRFLRQHRDSADIRVTSHQVAVKSLTLGRDPKPYLCFSIVACSLDPPAPPSRGTGNVEAMRLFAPRTL